ncbi:unnamed protein product [Agarophyton chilense]
MNFSPTNGTSPSYEDTVPTMHAELDAVLLGGVARSSLSEIYSTSFHPTQLLHTIAVSSCRGRGALLIDTRGTPASRLLQIAKSKMLTIKGKISIIRVFTFADASTLIHTLPTWLENVGGVDLIGLDCIADLFYTCIDNAAKRMEGFALRLRQLAIQFNAAVVITNAARIHQNQIMTVMGEQWHHVCASRFHMQQRPNCITIVKSMLTESKSIPYQLTEAGVVD